MPPGCTVPMGRPTVPAAHNRAPANPDGTTNRRRGRTEGRCPPRPATGRERRADPNVRMPPSSACATRPPFLITQLTNSLDSKQGYKRVCQGYANSGPPLRNVLLSMSVRPGRTQACPPFSAPPQPCRSDGRGRERTRSEGRRCRGGVDVPRPAVEPSGNPHGTKQHIREDEMVWRSGTRAVLALLCAASVPAGGALAQKAGGTLKGQLFGNPPSLSIHEESTVATIFPMMQVMSNLVIYDQHEPQNSLDTIRPELAKSWTWNDDKTEVRSEEHTSEIQSL